MREDPITYIGGDGTQHAGSVPLPQGSTQASRWRESVAVLVLRLILGTTMLWAGLGKFQHGQFTTEQAEYLKSAGVTALVPTPGVQPNHDRHFQGELPADSVRGLNVHYVTLITYACAQPHKGSAVLAPNRHGTQHISAGIKSEADRNILPGLFGAGSMPVVLAWSASIIQLVGGVFLILGACTRTSCVLVATVMIGASWMTQIGPYTVGGAQGGWMGFLPPLEEGLHPHGWKTVLWQWGLIANAFTLALLGAGRLSFDSFLRTRMRRERSIVSPYSSTELDLL